MVHFFSSAKKVKKRKGNTVCSPDSKYDWKEGSKSQCERFYIETELKKMSSKDGRVLKPILQGSCGFSVSGCL